LMRAHTMHHSPGALSTLSACFPHLGSRDVMVFCPGGLGQPVLHPVFIFRHYQQPVLGFGSQLVIRPVIGPRAWPSVQFALSSPPVDIWLQDAVDEVLALARQVLGAGEVHTVLLLDAQHLLDVGVVVGHGATDHDVEDHAQAPDVIHLGLGMPCSTSGAAYAADPQKVLLSAALGEAEVGQLDVEVFVKEKVLALEVSVDDIQIVAVLDGRGELAKHLACHILVQGSPAFDELEQVALDPKLHDDVDAPVRCLEDLVLMMERWLTVARISISRGRNLSTKSVGVFLRSMILTATLNLRRSETAASSMVPGAAGAAALYIPSPRGPVGIILIYTVGSRLAGLGWAGLGLDLEGWNAQHCLRVYKRLSRVSSEGEEKEAPKAQVCGCGGSRETPSSVSLFGGCSSTRPLVSDGLGTCTCNCSCSGFVSGCASARDSSRGSSLVADFLSEPGSAGSVPRELSPSLGQAPCLGLHPAVTEDLVDVQPPVDVRLEHAVDEVLALARQVLGAGKIDAVLLLDAQHLLDVGVVVRHGATDHDVEDHAQAPDVIHLGLGMPCSTSGAAYAADPQKVLLSAALGEAEVGQLDVEVFVKEKVLALEVSVDDIQIVAVLDGRGELGSPGLDKLEQVALDPELHDDNLNFPGKEFLQEVRGGFLAVYDLDCHVELQALRVSGFDFCVRALSQIYPHDVASSLKDSSIIHGAGSAQCL
ncbi:LOW QUALITY PROTEIN: hypothetical protein J0S82_016393, partial [Galemys pyrenaicus]